MKEQIMKLKKLLEESGAQGLQVLYNEAKKKVVIALDTVDRIPSGVLMAGQVTAKDGKVLIVIPYHRVGEAIKRCTAPTGKYRMRKYDTGVGFIDVEYAEVEVVGVPFDGAFTLRVLSADGRTGVAGVVPFKKGEV